MINLVGKRPRAYRGSLKVQVFIFLVCKDMSLLQLPCRVTLDETSTPKVRSHGEFPYQSNYWDLISSSTANCQSLKTGSQSVGQSLVDLGW